MGAGDDDDTVPTIWKETRGSIVTKPNRPLDGAHPVVQARKIVDPDTVEGKALKARGLLPPDTRTRSPDAILNNSKGLSAEVVAEDWVRSTYRGRAQLRAVMQRGANGVPVFDLVFETGTNEFILVEAKSYDASLGLTKDRVFVGGAGDAVGASGLQIVRIEEDVEQNSARWLEYRIEELQGSDGWQFLGNELTRSRAAGRLRVVLVRAQPGGRELPFEVLDYSEGIHPRQSQHRIPPGSEVGSRTNMTPVERGISRPVRSPEERGLSTHNELLRKDLKEASKRTTKARQQLKKAEDRLRTAQAGLAKANKNYQEAAASVRLKKAASVERWKRRLEAEEADVTTAEGLVEDAREAEAQIAKTIEKVDADIGRLEALREVRPTAGGAAGGAIGSGRPTNGERGIATPDKPPKVVTPAPPNRQLEAPKTSSSSIPHTPASEAVEQRVARGTEGGVPARPGPVTEAGGSSAITDVERGLETAERRMAHAPSAVSAIGKVSSVAKRASEVRSAARVALAIGTKAWRATRTIGNVVIHILLPLTPLDLAIEFALLAWDLWNLADDVEASLKQDAFEAVGKQRKAEIESEIEYKILDNQNTLERYMRRWNEDPSFSGFLYARVMAEMISDSRQRNFVQKVTVSDTYFEHATELTRNNYRQVQSATSVLKYTMYPPYLTPFDILLTKVTNLFIDTLYFTGTFNNDGEGFVQKFSDLGGIRHDETYEQQYEGVFEFSGPLVAARCEYCLKYLYWAAGRLSQHAVTVEDLEGNLENPAKGLRRRLWILVKLLEGKGSGQGYSGNFARFAEYLNRLVKDGSQTPETRNAMAELYLGASAIWGDLLRIERNISKPEYFYYGPKFKPGK